MNLLKFVRNREQTLRNFRQKSLRRQSLKNPYYSLWASGLIDFKIVLLSKTGACGSGYSSAIAPELCEIGKDAVGNFSISDKKTAKGSCPCGYL
jgi:hypothetical protein